MTYVNEPSVIVTSVIFIVLGTVTVLARFYAKHLKKNENGWDDWLSIPALFFTIASCITMIAGAAEHGVGGHIVIDPSDPEAVLTVQTPSEISFNKAIYVIQILEPLANGFIKLSMLAFYHRIFRGKVFKISNWTLIILTIFWMVGYTLSAAFPCGSHFSAYWGSFEETAEFCVDTFGLFVSNTISDVIMEFLILVLPLPFIWQLHMPASKKLGVSSVFLLGIFSLAAGTIRMGFMLKVQYFSHPGQTEPVLGLPSYDILGIVSFVLFWQLIQIGVAMVACCLPAMRPLVQDIPPKSFLGSLVNKVSSWSSSWSSSSSSKKSSAAKLSEQKSGTYLRPSYSSSRAFKPLGSAEEYSLSSVRADSAMGGRGRYDEEIGMKKEVFATAERV